MTIQELLDQLDGDGLIITDEGVIIDKLAALGLAPFDEIPEKPARPEVRETMTGRVLRP